MAVHPEAEAQSLRQLQQELRSVQAERDALQHDLEAMCISRGSSTFSSSYVIRWRQ